MTIRGRCSERLGLAGLVAAPALGVAFGVGGGTTYHAIAQCLCRAAELADEMGNYGNWTHSGLTQIDKSNTSPTSRSISWRP